MLVHLRTLAHVERAQVDEAVVAGGDTVDGREVVTGLGQHAGARPADRAEVTARDPVGERPGPVTGRGAGGDHRGVGEHTINLLTSAERRHCPDWRQY